MPNVKKEQTLILSVDNHPLNLQRTFENFFKEMANLKVTAIINNNENKKSLKGKIAHFIFSKGHLEIGDLLAKKESYYTNDDLEGLIADIKQVLKKSDLTDEQTILLSKYKTLFVQYNKTIEMQCDHVHLDKKKRFMSEYLHLNDGLYSQGIKTPLTLLYIPRVVAVLSAESIFEMLPEIEAIADYSGPTIQDIANYHYQQALLCLGKINDAIANEVFSKDEIRHAFFAHDSNVNRDEQELQTFAEYGIYHIKQLSELSNLQGFGTVKIFKAFLNAFDEQCKSNDNVINTPQLTN